METKLGHDPKYKETYMQRNTCKQVQEEDEGGNISLLLDMSCHAASIYIPPFTCQSKLPKAADREHKKYNATNTENTKKGQNSTHQVMGGEKIVQSSSQAVAL